MAEPWERQEGEPLRAFVYFEAYKGMGIGRSLEKLAALTQSGAVSVPPKSLTTFKTYSYKYKWQERIAAWEEMQAQLRLEIDLEETGNDHRQHIAELRQTFVVLGKKQVALGLKMLAEADAKLEAKEDSQEVVALARGANTLIGLSGGECWSKSLAIDKLLAEIGE